MLHPIYANSRWFITLVFCEWPQNFVTNAILLHTSVFWFSHIASILTDSCAIRRSSASCMSIVRSSLCIGLSGYRGAIVLCTWQALWTIKSSTFSIGFRGISQLGSAFIFLRWFKLAHICIQATSLHKWKNHGINHKFLIGNRFHVTLRIVSPIVSSNRIWVRWFYWNKIK